MQTSCMTSDPREKRHHPKAQAKGHDHPYRKLAVMATVSFIAMYVLMYMMVDATSDVYPNVNQLYMAAMMTAPMVVIELLLMRTGRAKVAIFGAAAIALVASIALVRRQTAVSDREFLRSMIPHHSAAVLMCERAPLRDVEIKQLCRGIVSSQQAEIVWMKRKLDRL